MSPVLTARPTQTSLLQGATERHLEILGGIQPRPGAQGVPDDAETIPLLGPREPDFWPAFKGAPEFDDGAADPLDRWSRRVIGDWARQIGATALFPFGGPPWLPFIDWARQTGRAWTSPVTVLVHATSGLFLSARGALALPWPIDLPAATDRPCDSCADRPCATGCPIGALGPSGYDTASCHVYLDTGAGADCMDNGCAVRRACPVSQSHKRLPAQSAFHMRAFHGTR